MVKEGGVVSLGHLMDQPIDLPGFRDAFIGGLVEGMISVKEIETIFPPFQVVIHAVFIPPLGLPELLPLIPVARTIENPVKDSEKYPVERDGLQRRCTMKFMDLVRMGEDIPDAQDCWAVIRICTRYPGCFN
jgi:hypothetical protein